MVDWQLNTRALHGDEGSEQDPWGATMPPIYASAAFSHETAEDIQSVFKGQSYGYLYSRISNPTVAQVESRIAKLEQGRGAVLSASGMASITALIMALTSAGDNFVSAKSLFGGTKELFEMVFRRFGVDTRYADTKDADSFSKLVDQNTRFIFVESIGNPKLDVPDFDRLSEIAKEWKIPLVVDGTLATPALMTAQSVSADIIVHSTTKYLSGNGASIGGVTIDTGRMNWKDASVDTIKELSPMAGNMAFLAYLRSKVMTNIGACLSPFNAFLIHTGLETLGLRMERHSENAQKVAEFLDQHSAVSHVRYLGLKHHDQHEDAYRYFNGKYGGLLTLQLGSKDRCFRFVSALKMVKKLANLGDSKTLVIHPASTIYHKFSSDELAEAGVTDDMIRLSVGIEECADIIADISQALDKMEEST